MDSHQNNSTKPVESDSSYGSLQAELGTPLQEYKIITLLVSAADISELSGWKKSRVLRANRTVGNSFPLPVAADGDPNGRCKKLYWSRVAVMAYFSALINGEAV